MIQIDRCTDFKVEKQLQEKIEQVSLFFYFSRLFFQNLELLKIMI